MLNNISPNLMANIQQTFPTTHLTDLASLVLELDGAKTHIGTISTCFSFNQCLDRYLHILLTFGVLTDEQQVDMASFSCFHKWGPVRGGGVVMSAVAVLKSSMSLFETCQMSPSEFRTNSAITWTTRFLYIGLIAYNHFVVTC
jgi:hypothetical protein